MPFQAKYMFQASDKLRPVFGPVRQEDLGCYSRRIMQALRTKEQGTRLARALALWSKVYVGDWGEPEAYETFLKSFRFLIDAIDDDDAGMPTDVASQRPNWDGRTLTYKRHAWRFRDQRGSLVLKILAGLQANGWKPYLELKEDEDRIRDARKQLQKRTQRILKWIASKNRVDWMPQPPNNSP